MSDNKKSKFGLGVAIGALLGGVAAFFLSPRSGAENRKMAMKKIDELIKLLKEKKLHEIAIEIYGKATEEGTKLYEKASAEMGIRLNEVKKSVDEIDQAKYKDLVMDVMDRVREEKEATQERLSKLQAYFMKRWDEGTKMATEDVKKVAEGTVHAVKKG